MKKGFWIDLLWYQFLQDALLQILIFKFIDRFYASHSLRIITPLPVFLQFLIIFVILDFIGYWMHRTQHQLQGYGAWFWRIHEVHHTTEDLNWLSGSRNHFLDLILPRVIGGGIMVLLGASDQAVEIFSVVGSLHGIFFHSNIRMKFGSLNYIINTPEMHRIHHLSDMRCQHSNFGDRLAIWDWIFGTAYLPDEEEIKDIPFGIGYYYPRHLPGHLLYMFRRKDKTG